MSRLNEDKIVSLIANRNYKELMKQDRVFIEKVLNKLESKYTMNQIVAMQVTNLFELYNELNELKNMSEDEKTHVACIKEQIKINQEISRLYQIVPNEKSDNYTIHFVEK
jgi:hypothetical protein